MNETDLRAMLRAEAETFHLDSAWRPQTSRLPRRPAKWLAMAGTAVALVAALLVFAETKPTSTPTVPAKPASIRLTGYDGPKNGNAPAALQRHMACMRDHGFDLPDPAWTGAGWILELDDVRALGVGTPRWKRVAFGACALVRDRTTYNRWIHDALMSHRPRSVQVRKAFGKSGS